GEGRWRAGGAHRKPKAPPAARAPGAPAPPPQAHPGWVYSLRFTPDGKYLVSAGNAPRNQGHLAVWSVGDGKLVYSADLPLGPIYSVAVSPDGKLLALGCGPRGRQFQDVPAYILKMPEAGENEQAGGRRVRDGPGPPGGSR